MRNSNNLFLYYGGTLFLLKDDLDSSLLNNLCHFPAKVFRIQYLHGYTLLSIALCITSRTLRNDVWKRRHIHEFVAGTTVGNFCAATEYTIFWIQINKYSQLNAVSIVHNPKYILKYSNAKGIVDIFFVIFMGKKVNTKYHRLLRLFYFNFRPARIFSYKEEKSNLQRIYFYI